MLRFLSIFEKICMHICILSCFLCFYHFFRIHLSFSFYLSVGALFSFYFHYVLSLFSVCSLFEARTPSCSDSQSHLPWHSFILRAKQPCRLQHRLDHTLKTEANLSTQPLSCVRTALLCRPVLWRRGHTCEEQLRFSVSMDLVPTYVPGFAAAKQHKGFWISDNFWGLPNLTQVKSPWGLLSPTWSGRWRNWCRHLSLSPDKVSGSPTFSGYGMNILITKHVIIDEKGMIQYRYEYWLLIGYTGNGKAPEWNSWCILL